MATGTNAIATETEVYNKKYYTTSSISKPTANKCCTKEKAIYYGVDEDALENYTSKLLVKYEDCYQFVYWNPGINLRIITKAEGLSSWIKNYEDLYFIVGVKYTTQDQTSYKETKLSVRKLYIATFGLSDVTHGGGISTCFNPYTDDVDNYIPNDYLGVTNIPLDSSYGGQKDGFIISRHPGQEYNLITDIRIKDSDCDYNDSQILNISVSLYGGSFKDKEGSGSGGGTLLKQLNTDLAICKGLDKLSDKNGPIIGFYGGPNTFYISNIHKYMIIYENSTVETEMQPYNLAVVGVV